jgi:hypothetical protein
MDQEVPNISETPGGAFPWLSAYPPNVPARVGAPP